jgi:hypothetical protein
MTNYLSQIGNWAAGRVITRPAYYLRTDGTNNVIGHIILMITILRMRAQVTWAGIIGR